MAFTVMPIAHRWKWIICKFKVDMADSSDSARSDTVACPHCGEMIARKAKFCRHCGSDETTGWSDASDHAIDWPDEADYEDAVNQEFGNKPGSPKSTGYPAWIKLAALAVALLFIWQILRALG